MCLISRGDPFVASQYLTNIIVTYRSTTEGSEHRRMLPVLTTLLRLSGGEIKKISDAIAVEEAGLLTKASSGIFSMFGGGGTRGHK